MLRFVLSFFGGIFSMLTLGLAMGAVALGAIFFVYGRDLPSTETLSSYSPPTISRIYNADGRIIDEFATQRRLFTQIEEIPPLVQHAFVSAEDQHFYTHPGFDVRGMAAAFADAVRTRGADLRGASTITQQVMKNFLLNADRTVERKIKEIILAVRIENALDKDHILELYLNEIFLGQNSYGVTAAAQSYYNKPLSQLSAGEAAYLAALAQRPGNLHPVYDHEDAVNRRNYVLRRMWEDGWIDEATYEAQREEPLETVQAGDYESFRSALPPRDYFSDEIRRQLSAEFGEEEFFSGGLAIRATVDADLQTEAAQALQAALERYDRQQGSWRGTGKALEPEALESEEAWRAALSSTRVPRDIALDGPWLPAVVLGIEDQVLRLGVEGVPLEGGPDSGPTDVPREDIAWLPGDFFETFEVGDVVMVRRMTSDEDGSFLRWTLRQVPRVQGAFMAMDVNTGRVLAMQGGFSYQYSVFNRATQAMRQPGSSFKPFVYASALDSGFTPASIVVDAPIEINTPQGMWRPMNASNRFYGPTPLRTGIEQSRNIMTIRLAQEVGMDTVARYAERFGVYDDLSPFLSNALGAQETTLYKMVAAYAMFANGGERVEPTLVDRVQDRNGNTVYSHDTRACLDCAVPEWPRGEGPRIMSNRDRIMNDVTAYQLTSMMQGVIQRGTGRGISLPVPVAGKSGTTNDARDVWFIGFTSNIVAGCYIGFDNPRPLGRGASGGGTCGPVFQTFMRHAVERFGGSEFPVPQGCRFINIDRYTGARMPDGASGENVQRECFRAGEEPLFGVTFDGGFAMASDLPLYNEAQQNTRQVETSEGNTVTVGPNASFGTLSSGGLY
ncbi:penicillin-binding protein 1A [Pseudoroseicyclus aestuarii]|uniref:Penicillin-binding protein 1A n=1 Tax=Pseudoroseicyclus aestuarii TaxID=1795041 RepID=A0A318TBS6_9RHOB|nr:PBP1A family penicillin-binding protein [Pseudoroseicyclus aestuarii]PYE85788.1 penicillin-binding protein 1A [Pseudoroseicyclus aestuarii]